MKLKTAITHFSTILLLAISGTSQAVLTTYNNQASFLVDVGTATTYDFETGSGFPDASGGGFQTIGLFDGINFDATTFDAGASVAISGTQVMSGAGGSFTPATLTFAPGTTGLGFFALDLTIVGSEVIQLLVDFDAGPDQTFNIGQLNRADAE